MLLSVRMSVYVCVCLHVYACPCMSMYVCMSVCEPAFLCMFVYARVCLHICKRPCMFVCHMCIHSHVCMSVHVPVCVYVYVRSAYASALRVELLVQTLLLKSTHLQRDVFVGCCMYVCMSACVCMCVCLHVCECVCIIYGLTFLPSSRRGLAEVFPGAERVGKGGVRKSTNFNLFSYSGFPRGTNGVC